MTTVTIQQIMDQNDEKQIMELIVRLGVRAVHFSNGELNVMLANAIAIQMLRSISMAPWSMCVTLQVLI